ncbi:cobalt-precorrin-5B (C(1))-methyltransferase [Thermogymnomonas acidicola]|uniref:cobalt-precorrin-5B (C(1))-methyltransferase n=1 Tax=Thermogymnomonas acidicola TaxID=399579 RepID=UPI00149479C2|nr:cobalt-precorrin-5B (C(1))-methyltransferase [Thermogymnomonas acidicola]
MGIVTSHALPVPPGESAINPVPRRMIEEAVLEAMPGGGVAITILVPGGAEVAKKTLNPGWGGRGGGISVLGTTGIEEPVSNEAYSGHIRRMVVSARCVSDTLVVCPGNTSEKIARETLGVLPEAVIVTGGDRGGHSARRGPEKGVQQGRDPGHAREAIEACRRAVQHTQPARGGRQDGDHSGAGCGRRPPCRGGGEIHPGLQEHRGGLQNSLRGGRPRKGGGRNAVQAHKGEGEGEVPWNRGAVDVYLHSPQGSLMGSSAEEVLH